MMVSVFGAIVLAGTADTLPINGVAVSGIPAVGFSRIFFAAALSMTVAFVALVRLEEKPLRTDQPAPTRRA
jgi:hypothetical protein